jgi:hypothetical protein
MLGEFSGSFTGSFAVCLHIMDAFREVGAQR